MKTSAQQISQVAANSTRRRLTALQHCCNYPIISIISSSFLVYCCYNITKVQVILARIVVLWQQSQIQATVYGRHKTCFAVLRYCIGKTVMSTCA